jgi:hypothetical protein
MIELELVPKNWAYGYYVLKSQNSMAAPICR